MSAQRQHWILIGALVLSLTACQKDKADTAPERSPEQRNEAQETPPDATPTAPAKRTDADVPREPPGKAVGIVAGRQHSCALLEDQSVWCWGAANFKQVTGPEDPEVCNNTGYEGPCYGRPQQIARPSPATPARTPDMLVAGSHHNCLMRDKGVHCWGAGPLGYESTEFCDHIRGPVGCASTPRPVAVQDIAAIAAGGLLSCAWTTAGTLSCWGSNVRGQLGAAELTAFAPSRVPEMDSVVSAGMGEFHACVATADGTVACAGDNPSGQLGDGTQRDRRELATIEGLSNVTAVVAGNAHSCALDADGAVWCWGSNARGQLGDNSFVDRHRPVRLELPKVRQVSAGSHHTCALADDQAYCWGANHRGQIGDGSVDDRPSPMAIEDISVVTAIAAGHQHSCAVSNGAVECWGANDAGQLGTGISAGDSPNAIEVRW